MCVGLVCKIFIFFWRKKIYQNITVIKKKRKMDFGAGTYFFIIYNFCFEQGRIITQRYLFILIIYTDEYLIDANL